MGTGRAADRRPGRRPARGTSDRPGTHGAGRPCVLQLRHPGRAGFLDGKPEPAINQLVAVQLQENAVPALLTLAPEYPDQQLRSDLASIPVSALWLSRAFNS